MVAWGFKTVSVSGLSAMLKMCYFFFGIGTFQEEEINIADGTALFEPGVEVFEIHIDIDGLEKVGERVVELGLVDIDEFYKTKSAYMNVLITYFQIDF